MSYWWQVEDVRGAGRMHCAGVFNAAVTSRRAGSRNSRSESECRRRCRVRCARDHGPTRRHVARRGCHDVRAGAPLRAASPDPVERGGCCTHHGGASDACRSKVPSEPLTYAQELGRPVSVRVRFRASATRRGWHRTPEHSGGATDPTRAPLHGGAERRSIARTEIAGGLGHGT